MSHDADNPAVAHLRVAIDGDDALARVQAMVAETVRYDRSGPGEPIRSIDVLVTAEQLEALERAGIPFEHIAHIWSKDELPQQVSQENRYADQLRQHRKPPNGG